MMKLKNYALLGLIGLMGILTIGVASADIQVTYYADSDISYTLNGNELFTGVGTVTIKSGDITITLMDRNLGATSNDIYSTGSYGYYFQWGNNYGFDGFDPAVLANAVETQVDASGYGPGNYYTSGTFLLTGNWSSVPNNNLRGGSGDEGDNAYWGYPSINPEDRRGPCPDGFHVPSRGEWAIVIKMLVYKTWDWDVYGFIRTNLFIPLAGFFWNGIQYTDNGYFWTSSPIGSMAKYIQFEDWAPSLYTSNNASIGTAFPVRCFYDEYEVYTKKSNLLVSFWTGEDTSLEPACSGEVALGEVISGDLLTCVNELSKQGYSLSGRRDDEADARWTLDTQVMTGLNLRAVWTPENFNITYNLDGGEIEPTVVNPTSYTIESDDITLANPSKEGYTFAGWTGTDLDSATMSVTIGKGSTGDRKYYATWTANPKPVSHGGGGSTLRKDNCPNGDYSDSYYDGTCGKNPNNMSSGTEGEGSIDDNKDSSSQSSSEGQSNNELQTAYEFAYENKITTMDSIEKADMEGGLTRIAMAKMLSQYAINVLGKKPANTIVPKFSDITEGLNAEYDYGVSLAYQLGIMGINMPENKFRPFDKVTRAEFVTALSRLLYDTEDGEILYYSTHMELLNKMGIISVTDPDMKELRGYVMLMLMRTMPDN